MKNAEGTEMIKWMGEKGVGIINRSTKGDEGGDYVYIEARGLLSTIDYILRNDKEEVDEVVKVKETEGSDHM